MNLLDRCERWFEEKEYPVIRLGDNLLHIVHQGLKVFIPYNSNDSSFFKMDASYDFRGLSVSRYKHLEAVSKFNKQRKVVKAYLDDDDESLVVFTTELLLDTTPQVEDMLPRLLDMLQQAELCYLLILNEKK